jgi:hypothetical protein
MTTTKNVYLVIRSAFASLAFGATVLGLANCTSTSPTPIIILTPLPTAAPTAVPPAAINQSTSALSFTTAGSIQSFTVSESGYSGTLTAANGSPSCAGIATFSPASGTGPSAAFMVTAVAAGTCTIKVSDANGQSVGVSVTVTTTAVSAS